MKQCCGSGSGFNGVPRYVSVSGSKRAKITSKHRKMLVNFIFLSDRCSFLMADGFSCSLEIKKIAIFDQKKIKKYSAVFYSSIFGHQNPGSGLDRDLYSLETT
jgi:hypothetical protein